MDGTEVQADTVPMPLIVALVVLALAVVGVGAYIWYAWPGPGVQEEGMLDTSPEQQERATLLRELVSTTTQEGPATQEARLDILEQRTVESQGDPTPNTQEDRLKLLESLSQ